MRPRLAPRLARMTNCEASSARLAYWPDRRSLLRLRVALILPVAAGEAGLIAGRDFRCVERLSETGFRGAWFQRLLLAFMRGPSAKVEDFESRAHLATHAREAIGVNLERLGERIPPHRLS